MRLAIKLIAFRYIVIHLLGDQNVWVDMLTRWAVNPVQRITSSNTPRAKALMVAPINPGVDSKLDWPNIEDIKEAQSSANEAPPKQFFNTTSGLRNPRDVLWIPSESKILKFRITIAAHSGHGGHRSANVAMATVKAH